MSKGLEWELCHKEYRNKHTKRHSTAVAIGKIGGKVHTHEDS